ncbi:hypothetical protein, partial [Thiobacillus sp. 63-78]|uniref:hypothetical protein n=1 Tax=Thiobacillus sp. 63-78 TaxID=1895859 RepID=UPI0025D4478E
MLSKVKSAVIVTAIVATLDWKVKRIRGVVDDLARFEYRYRARPGSNTELRVRLLTKPPQAGGFVFESWSCSNRLPRT